MHPVRRKLITEQDAGTEVHVEDSEASTDFSSWFRERAGIYSPLTNYSSALK
jgi:hypothetical protein